MTLAIIYSLVICALGAALEGLFAGRGVKQRLANLRSPSYAVPFWGWMLIGAGYYMICFTILYRLFTLPSSHARNVAFALLAAMMFINALWNYFFFRAGNFFHAYMLGLPYGGVAFALFLLLLFRVDRMAAGCLAPYIIYLFYANIWSYRIWKLNPSIS